MEFSDVELIASVQEGNLDRFEELIGRYQTRVFSLVRRFVRSETEVADLAQEIFIKAFEKLGSFRGEAPFEHWLMRLATHACYDHLRRSQRRKEVSINELSNQETDWLSQFAVAPELASEEADAARLLIQRLLEQLSPASRLVITLVELEERSVKDVAALTGWSLSLVKVRAFRARREMRRLLKKLDTQRYL